MKTDNEIAALVAEEVFSLLQVCGTAEDLEKWSIIVSGGRIVKTRETTADSLMVFDSACLYNQWDMENYGFEPKENWDDPRVVREVVRGMLDDTPGLVDKIRAALR